MRGVVAGVVVLVAAAACVGSADPEMPAGTATVVQVIDGDTIDVRIGGRAERVRLIGIDTPETKRPDAPVECFGPEATAFTESLLPAGTTVRIERDIVGRDHFGRLLGYVHLVDDAGAPTTFVNVEIVRRGFATPMSIPPNTVHASAFTEAAREAEAADLGLWAWCST
jgi:micrococcal nuclease